MNVILLVNGDGTCLFVLSNMNPDVGCWVLAYDLEHFLEVFQKFDLDRVVGGEHQAIVYVKT
jgi:hypothetical protein